MSQPRYRIHLIRLLHFLIVVPNVFVSLSTAKSRGGDFRGYLIAGERLLAGRFLYEGSRVATDVTWPPFFAVFIAPFALLSRLNLPLTQMLWYGINIALFYGTVHLWCKLVYGKPLGWFDEGKELSLYSAAVVLPVLLTLEPLLKNFVQLQINVMILFLMSLGFVRLQERKESAAGIWFGLAAAIKAFPVAVLVYLVFRRKVRAAAVMGVTGLVLTALPVFRYGIPSYLDHVHAWIRLSLSGGYPIGSLNQSVYAMVTRWIASDPLVLMKMKLPPPAVADPRTIAATWVFRGMFLLFLGGFLVVTSRKRPWRLDLDGAFWILLSTVFSPVAWVHYWVMIFPAVFVLWRELAHRPDRAVRWLFWSSAFLITGLNVVSRVFVPLKGFAHSVLSSMTLGALALLVALLVVLARGTRSGAYRTPSQDSLHLL
jgi:hypothetical protein